MKDVFEIGFKAHYIGDKGFEHCVELPIGAAVTWAASVLPDMSAECGKTFSELMSLLVSQSEQAAATYWMNKMYVVVAYEHDYWYAIGKHDFGFHLYRRRAS